MIIRIMGEGQYRLNDTTLARLADLDDQVVDAVNAGDDESFQAALAELLGFVEERGNRLPDDELAVSDHVLPHRDTTVAEAREVFADEAALATTSGAAD